MPHTSLPKRAACAAGLSFLLAACGPAPSEGPGPAAVDRCAEAIDALSVCYPDLATDASCTDETVAAYDRLQLSGGSCDALDQKTAKADLIAPCPAGQHTCAGIFCCKNYLLNWKPGGEADWNIVATVQAFQSAAPAAPRRAIEGAGRDALMAGLSRSWVQDVVESPGGKPVEMAVHLTRGLAQVSFADFLRRLPAADWGIRLDHYLGGQVKVYRRDAGGRPVRQVERMVLSPFPCNMESRLTNNDMTKVEVIVYGKEQATVYWRVRFSANRSTETDVGSVDFRRYDDRSTLITFHSAHRLNLPLGIHIASELVRPALEKTFLDFVRGYQRLVER